MGRFAASIFAGVVILVGVCPLQARFKLHSATSSLSLAIGSELIVSSPITNFSGTVVQDHGATISEREIGFSAGTLQANSGSLLITGTLFPNGAIKLSGNQLLSVDREGTIPGPVIASSGNRVVGTPSFSSPLTLQDVNTTVTLELHTPVNQNILLNNGLIYLGNDLSFADGFGVTGSGICDLGGQTVRFGAKPLAFTQTISWRNAGKLSFGSDVALSGTWVFKDMTVLSGKNNTISLSGDGSIVVSPGAALKLDGVRLAGLRQNTGSLGTYNLRCLDAGASVTLHNSDLLLDSNFDFSMGCLAIDAQVALKGPHIFSYRSANDLTIKPHARLTIDRGTTISYASVSADKNHIVLEDPTSELFLDACTLHGTTTGIRLSTGRLFINDKVVLSSEATVPAEANELNASTLSINILAGATLDVQGILVND